jgi:PEP-CTERM motif
MAASCFSVTTTTPTLVRKYGAIVLAAAIPFSVSPALAGSFTINTNSTSAQTLGSGAGQTGTVNAGSSLTVSGSSVAVTISGNNATLTNLGTISQTGTGRVIRDNTGVTGLVINNGSSSNSSALLQSADADVIQMNKSSASVTLNNYGTMTSLNASKGGAQAVDFNAITSGSNIVNNYATGILHAQDADAVRPGANGIVYNWGMIKATNSTDPSDDGIDTQNNTGVTVYNYGTGSIIGARHGITGGAADNTVTFSTAITNTGSITGNNGSGINLDGFNAKQTASITNSGTIIGNGVTGDGDGIDVDGVVNITNTGTIRSINAFSATTPAQSEGITVGGGTITNSGTIEGLVTSGNTNAVGRGITLAGVDTSGTPEAIYANSIITNQAGGLIRGQSDSAIAVGGPASGFTVTVNNEAGARIVGGGSTNAAIKTGADNDTINNAGVIDGSSSGKAIDMGGGNNKLNINGGSASILGNINGGSGGQNTMTLDPGTGKSFSYGGSISNFQTVEIKSGTVNLSGASNYSGTTLLSGGILQLNGANLLSSNSLLDMHGGELDILNATGVNGQTFAGLTLSGSSTIELHASSLTFNSLGAIGGGLSLSWKDYMASTSPYAFRLLGDYSTNADFLTLMNESTIDGRSTFFSFDGTYTDVSAAPVPVPSTILLFGTGIAGLFGVARRKRN